MKIRSSASVTVLGSLATLAALLVVAVGCSSNASTRDARSSPALVQPMTPGMTMPDGGIMGASAPSETHVASAVARPSEAAAMICAAEFRADVAEALDIHAVAPGTAAWANSLNTCTYHLFGGRLVLSVKDLPTAAATTTYFTARRDALAAVQPLHGLTAGAVGDGAGIVVLRKDNHVLTVDTSHLPQTFGSQHNKRADFAYEVASVVLGCWTGD